MYGISEHLRGSYCKEKERNHPRMPKKGKKLKNIHHQNTHPSPSYHYEKKIQNSSLKKITTKLAQQSQPQLHKNNLILEGTLSQYGKYV